MPINEAPAARLRAMLADNRVLRLTLSGAFRKDNPDSKIHMTAHSAANGLTYQTETYRGKQVFHCNFADGESLADWLLERLPAYKQCEFATAAEGFLLLQSKSGTQTLKKTKAAPAAPKASHNRQKDYILPEGTPVRWLISLGVMLADGTVPAAKQKKFKQINRFLEMVDDVADSIPDDARIIDAGCGKSYLTFALYDYLRRMQKKKVEIVGLDLKADVVAHCAALAERLGFEHLHFYAGDIADYAPQNGRADMVVSLHACDIATDFALYNAVRWGAKVILSVPCCQHELFPQIQNDVWKPLLKHGILKERLAALATDALRAELLDAAGYTSLVTEFIDMEHTPKNLMLRAEQRAGRTINPQALGNARALMQELHVLPKLYTLLEGGGFLCRTNKA